MKNLLYSAFALLILSLCACTGKDKPAAADAVATHFDITFVNTYNDSNVARADSAFAELNTLGASNQAYLALFYAQSSDKSFENSQRYMENAIKAYKAAMAADTAAVNNTFANFGMEYHLSVPDIHAAFARNEDMLNGVELPDSYTIDTETEVIVGGADSIAAEVPEQTLEEALEAVGH
ncbi:MAG: hypothetical protein K2O79_03585 [Muribaculaceae bacterium]|nr:hypothetical protein [Muribaculaceae bacterium]